MACINCCAKPRWTPYAALRATRGRKLPTSSSRRIQTLYATSSNSASAACNCISLRQIPVHILASRSSLYPEIAEMFEDFEGSYDPRLALLLHFNFQAALDENQIYLQQVRWPRRRRYDSLTLPEGGRPRLDCRMRHQERRERIREQLHLGYKTASACATSLHGGA
jgi:hypothetical protein